MGYIGLFLFGSWLMARVCGCGVTGTACRAPTDADFFVSGMLVFAGAILYGRRVAVVGNIVKRYCRY